MNPYNVQTIDVHSLDDTQLARLFSENRITLTREEAEKIQRNILQRIPTVAELILWSIQGSEHCSYKSTRHLLKQFVTDGPTVILGPGEDAGIVEVARDNAGIRYGIVISHESHNHPSQVLPFEGAATGVGGNVRDVSCMGAKVIGNADPLRFGQIERTKTRWLHDGVVAGIAGYGNPIGVPVIAGDTYYDESYNDNCLVNIVTLGVVAEPDIIHSRAPKDAEGYRLILVGKPTDMSGFGGASFASLTLSEDKKDINKGAVQEPNAFLKRHLLKATYTLFDVLKKKGALDKVGFKDLGAGGIACAAVELADNAGYGATITLDHIPTAIEHLDPSVILCSETQERYMWVAHPDMVDTIIHHYNNTFALDSIANGACAQDIGCITTEPRLVVTYQGSTLVNAPAFEITRGLKYERPYKNPEKTCTEPTTDFVLNTQSDRKDSLNNSLLTVLAHPNVASKACIYEKYDKQVQGITVLEPGQADAGVIQPFKDHEWPDEIRQIGIALSVDHNPRYSKIDPYWGAVNAICEAARNVAAVGATPWAFTDCLNFGNPEKPEHMWEFKRAVEGICDAQKSLRLKHFPTSPIPIISGNVSLYNENVNGTIAPSPVIACLGRLSHVDKVIDMSLKENNSTLLLMGTRKNECGGSVYYEGQGFLGANVPRPDVDEVEKQIFSLTDAIFHGFVLSAHDISDGGLATCLAEMSFHNDIGFSVDISSELPADVALFSETGGFILEVKTNSLERVQEIFAKRGVNAHIIGQTNMSGRINMNNVIDLSVKEAKRTWENGLRKKLV